MEPGFHSSRPTADGVSDLTLAQIGVVAQNNDDSEMHRESAEGMEYAPG
jgi:hypothetical protein